MSRFSLLIAAALLAGMAPGYAADEEPLSTDRPDISEASVVVGPGRFQIETGVQQDYQRGGRGTARVLTTPTLLRWGLDNRWEARLETDGYMQFRRSGSGSNAQTAGLSPLSPGFKYHFQDPREGSSRPSLGVLMHVAVPTGSSQFRQHYFAGDLKLAADFEFGAWSLGTNVGVLVDRDDEGDTFAAGLATASLSRGLSERLRAFTEVALGGSASRPLTDSVILDGGFTYLLNPDTQLDVALGTDLSQRSAPDLYWTVGLSRRF